MSLDNNKAEFLIPSRPDLTFKAWYNPDDDWLAIEGFDADNVMRVGVGCRMAQATPAPEVTSD
ncbi:hypothetical protein [Rhodococcus qingshengii]|uniref:hypothetical protein n=1 Tax=Rhodococcus qingshengii TaxID=334542 RepID=UPI0035DA4248